MKVIVTLPKPFLFAAPIVSFLLYYLRSEIYYGISFIVSTIVQTISLLIFGALVPLLTAILQLVMILFTQVLIPLLTVVISLLTVVSNLLLVIAILIIPIGGLLIAALFTCPSEDSFTPWFKSFLSFAMRSNQPKQPTTTTHPTTTQPTTIESTKSTDPQNKPGRLDRLYQYAVSSAKTYVFDPWFPTLFTKLAIKDQQFMFFGFCRMSYCTMVNDDEIVFIGAFNTWIPWKTK